MTILVILVAAAAALAGDDAHARFRKAFSGDASVEERSTATRLVAAEGDRKAADALVDALVAQHERIEDLAHQRHAVRREIAGLVGRLQVPEGEVRTLKGRETALRRQGDDEAAVRDELRRGLRRCRDPKAVALLRSTVGKRKVPSVVRAWVLEALVGMEAEGVDDLLRATAEDKDAVLREAALRALAGGDAADATLAVLAAGLEDPSWTVRLAAARRLAGMRVPEAVDRLIARLREEPGRLRQDIASLLSGLTGQRFGIHAEGWEHWWQEHRPEFVAGTAKFGDPEHPAADEGRAEGGVSYYGITTFSNRILYVIDISGSMNEPGVDPALLKVDEAKRELQRTLKTLQKGSSFSILAFDDAVRLWRPHLVEVDAGTRGAAAKWVEELWGATSTNTYAALEEAFRLSAAGDLGADYGGGADTIFLLSDGAPTTPDGKLKEGDRIESVHILETVREWNRGGRVVIHTIGIGIECDTRFMGRLARENGGRFVHVK